MAYTETTTKGYGTRVGNSFRGIGTGFLLFLAGTALLWWNEGRVVKTDKMLNEAEDVTVELETIDRIDPEMEGKLVYATGLADTKDTLTDASYGVSAVAIRLVRNVEYYQWVEHEKEEKTDKLGGKEETKTTYTYAQEWTDSPVSSSEFKDATYRDKNFVLSTAEPFSWMAQKVTFGAFELNESQIRSISGEEPVVVEPDSARLASWLKDTRATMRLRYGGNTDSVNAVRVADNMLYFGVNPASPSVGDVRVTWTKTVPARVSLIAKQKGKTFAKFKAKNGKTFSSLVMGEVESNEIYDNAHSSNHTLMWIFRVLGLVLVIFGLKGIFDFIQTLLKVVPFISNIIGWGVGVICTVIGIAWSLIVIAIAWLFYRPLVAILLLVVAGFLVWVFAFKGKDKLKELANRSKDPSPAPAAE